MTRGRCCQCRGPLWDTRSGGEHRSPEHLSPGDPCVTWTQSNGPRGHDMGFHVHRGQSQKGRGQQDSVAGAGALPVCSSTSGPVTDSGDNRPSFVCWPLCTLGFSTEPTHESAGNRFLPPTPQGRLSPERRLSDGGHEQAAVDQRNVCPVARLPAQLHLHDNSHLRGGCRLCGGCVAADGLDSAGSNSGESAHAKEVRAAPAFQARAVNGAPHGGGALTPTHRTSEGPRGAVNPGPWTQ